MNKKDIKTEEKYDWKKRPLSWSAISSFEYDPEQWYKKYYLNIEQATSKEMEFGKKIGKMLETDPTFLPMIKRHSKMEHPFKCMFGKIELVGFADTFCDLTFKKLDEFKTGKKAWDQKRADTHGQLDMYLLMNFIINKIKPEDVELVLVWMPTQDNADFSISFVEPIEKNIRMFKTKRTMMHILKFGERINSVRKQMENYVKWRENNEPSIKIYARR